MCVWKGSWPAQLCGYHEREGCRAVKVTCRRPMELGPSVCSGEVTQIRDLETGETWRQEGLFGGARKTLQREEEKNLGS